VVAGIVVCAADMGPAESTVNATWTVAVVAHAQYMCEIAYVMMGGP
jgi:hypothetical protein